MTTQAFKETDFSLIDAVETLSNIADLDLERELGITEDHELKIQDHKLTYRTVHWLNDHNADSVGLITDRFRSVLNYLRNFYSKEYSLVKDPKAADGIKTIMVLVGEAAKKLDKYTSMFQHVQNQSSVDLKEYKQLQEFYLSKIARTIDEGILGKWILALSQRALKKRKPIETKPVSLKGHRQPLTKHVFVDLESVKKDTEYELFFLRKEDGTRFFSPRLVRNIKLVCDFGNYFSESKLEDPFQDMNLILDRYIQSSAKSLFRTLHSVINRFYREGLIYRQNELVEMLNKTIMSLMLASNTNNLKRNDPIKCCTEYFFDFQRFLREVTQSREYQKLAAYAPDKGSPFARCLLETVQAISCGFVTSMQGFADMAPVIGRWIEEARNNDIESHKHHAPKSLVDHLRHDYAIMNKYIKKHPNGPLIKVLESLERGTYHFFDPCWQHNLPSQLYSLYLNDQRMVCLHMPSPTYQEYINKASVNEEFKAMLGALSSNYMMMSKYLLINLQDRTSWKEHFRCSSLEELQRMHQFEPNLTVVTINHDTEFYNQLAPYNNDNDVSVFMGHFVDHLSDGSSGFYYSKDIKKALFPEFVDDMLKSIHQVFFGGKNVLSRDRRMDFIQIFYLFLELKIIELVKPDAFSLTCKDGIDSGCTANALLFAFLKLLSNEKMSEQDHDLLNVILYGPALIVRERAIMPERFNRMLSALKVIENTKEELGYAKFRESIETICQKHFKLSFLDSRIAFPKAV